MLKNGSWNDWMNGSAWYRGDSGEFKAVHPCPKALNDCREIVRRYTVKSKLVVDVFAGVGTIPLACELEGREPSGSEAMTNRTRSSFSTACPLCRHQVIRTAEARDHLRVEIVPNIPELRKINHPGTAKRFECQKCKREWEETVERSH